MKSKTTAPAGRKLQHLAQGRSEIFKLPQNIVLVEPGYNERRDMGDIPALADNIDVTGEIVTPFIVEKPPGEDFVYIREGHRRRAAIDLLISQGRLPQDFLIPCKAIKVGSTPLSRLLLQLSANSGKALTLLEKARLYLRTKNLAEEAGEKISQQDIAKHAQTTKQAVSNALTLIEKGSPFLLDLIEKEKISGTTALDIIKANPEHKDQDTAAKAAQQTAQQSNSTHITPKHLPPTDPEKNQKSEIKNPQSSINPAEDDSKEQPTSPTPPIPPSPAPLFNLHNINNTPITGDTDGYHYESNRLALINPPAGIITLHLLSAIIHEKFCFGYRINHTTQLPNENNELSDLGFDDGYNQALDAALEAGNIKLNDTALEQLNQAVYDALCTYYPEQGEAKEPEQLEFADCNKKSAIDRLTNAPSSNRDGSAPGSGEGKYSPPDKQLEAIDKLLEDLDKKELGLEDRITTTEIIVDVLRNTRSIKDLRTHLTGK